jgi:DNA-binding MurR/RpiR family transcriptional regulator
MKKPENKTFGERLAQAAGRLSTAETDVANYFRDNREEVLVASAVELAQKIGTSDATVIRSAKALGYAGLHQLRRQLAAELRVDLSPAARLTRTLGSARNEGATPLGLTVDIHIQALERLQSEISPGLFKSAIKRLAAADRIFVFGLGPSSALADYFVIQLRRFGREAVSLTQTGLLLADGLHRLRRDDVLVVLAYSRIYQELDALLRCAKNLAIPAILLTDTLGPFLHKRVEMVLPVVRGRTEGFSTHTATLGLIEALLIGIAIKSPAETVSQLRKLNDLRASLAGEANALPLGSRPAGHQRTKRGRDVEEK